MTGANGFVAGSILIRACAARELHAVSRGQPLPHKLPLQWHRISGEAEADWGSLLAEIRPQAIIHTAAMANIDECEKQPEKARAVNVGQTGILARYCAEQNCRLILCSTDSVFEGERAPYTEVDIPTPVNIYAGTKVEAERIVGGLGKLGVVARLSLVLGLPALGTGNSMLSRMMDLLRHGREIAMPGEEVRTPIDVSTLAEALVELADSDYFGIMHLAGNTRINRHELGLRLAERMKLPASLVQGASAGGVAGRARRPRDVSLVNLHARDTLRTPMLDFDATLDRALRGVKG